MTADLSRFSYSSAFCLSGQRTGRCDVLEEPTQDLRSDILWYLALIRRNFRSSLVLFSPVTLHWRPLPDGGCDQSYFPQTPAAGTYVGGDCRNSKSSEGLVNCSAALYFTLLLLLGPECVSGRESLTQLAQNPMWGTRDWLPSGFRS